MEVRGFMVCSIYIDDEIVRYMKRASWGRIGNSKT